MRRISLHIINTRQSNSSEGELRTIVIKIARRSANCKGATNAYPKRSKGERDCRPPNTDKSLRDLEKESVEDQECSFYRPQHHEYQQRHDDSELQVGVIERICERWSGFFFEAYPRDSGRIWESSCVCTSESDEENKGKEMGSIVPIES